MAVHPKILTKGVNGQSIGRSFGPGPFEGVIQGMGGDSDVGDIVMLVTLCW